MFLSLDKNNFLVHHSVMTWWQAYLWVYTILSALGLLTLLPQVPLFNFVAWEGLLESLVVIIGTYSFAYKKRILPSNAWRILFILISCIWVAQFIYYSNIFPAARPTLQFLEMYPQQGAVEIILSILLSLPALFALYKLGFTNVKMTQKSSKTT